MRSARVFLFVLASLVAVFISAGVVMAHLAHSPVRLAHLVQTVGWSSPGLVRPRDLVVANDGGIVRFNVPQRGSSGTGAFVLTPRSSQPAEQRPKTPWEQLWDRINNDPRMQDYGRPVVRIGQDFSLRPADSTRDVVVVSGSATIEGYVRGDVVVTFGNATMGEDAVISGSLVVVGGNATVAAGSLVGRDVRVFGGTLEAAPGFTAGGEQMIVGAAPLGARLQAIVPWFTQGLLWGRPFVPSLGWMWWVVSILFILYFLVSLVFHEPVRAASDTLTKRPLSSLMAGLLVLFGVAPLALLLAISVIGLLVVPFALCAVVVAGIVGKVGVTRAIGASVIRPTETDSRPQAMRSFLIGSGVILLLYVIPVIGLIAWALIGVFGLGSAVLTFFAALRRENPAPPPRARVVPPAPPPVEAPPPASSGPTGGFVPAMPFTAASEHASAAPVPTPAPIPAGGPMDLAAFPRAGFLERTAAFGLDLLLCLFLSLWFDDHHGQQQRYFMGVVLYHIGFWTWKGTTIGGIICNLRVIRYDGGPLRFVDAVVRGLSGIFSILALGLGGLWILKDPEQQSWHDKISGTFVVKVPRGYPVP